MRMRRSMEIAVGSIALVSGSAAAQTATQVVNFRVDAVSQLAVSGNPAPLIVSAAQIDCIARIFARAVACA